MFYTIYKITNIINGKYYIGKHQTKYLDDGYLGSGKLLRRAITKYGIDNFHKEILHICPTEKQMNILEKILVVPDVELNYNLCPGGQGGFGYINDSFWTEEKRLDHNRKVSPFTINRVVPEKTKENISKALTGLKKKPLSAEARKRIADTQRNKKRKPFSKEWRNNMSKAQLGKKRGPYKKKTL